MARTHHPAARLGALAILTALLILAGSLRTLPVMAGQGDHRAGLIIRYGEGHIQTACVSFDELEISGEQLLMRSGLAATIDYNAGLGGAVCSIDGLGCSYPADDCFCQCTGADCQYWAYYLHTDDGWHYSQLGASSVTVSDGDVQSWSWGPGNFASGTEPPQISFAKICEKASTAAGTTGMNLRSIDIGEVSQTTTPGYTAFAVTAGLMLGAGAVVLRRRGNAPRDS